MLLWKWKGAFQHLIFASETKEKTVKTRTCKGGGRIISELQHFYRLRRRYMLYKFTFRVVLDNISKFPMKISQSIPTAYKISFGSICDFYLCRLLIYFYFIFDFTFFLHHCYFSFSGVLRPHFFTMCTIQFFFLFDATKSHWSCQTYFRLFKSRETVAWKQRFAV
jgi:hypothetical protein